MVKPASVAATAPAPAAATAWIVGAYVKLCQRNKKVDGYKACVQQVVSKVLKCVILEGPRAGGMVSQPLATAERWGAAVPASAAAAPAPAAAASDSAAAAPAASPSSTEASAMQLMMQNAEQDVSDDE